MTRSGEPPVSNAGTETGLLATQRTALRFLLAAPVLLTMILIRAADGFGSASHNVGLPVYSSTLDPAHPAAFVSQFWATWAAGNILAQLTVGRWSKLTGRAVGERAFALGACLMSAASSSPSRDCPPHSLSWLP
jgi:hypothetical protein